jgi:hypothetical protein
MADDPEDTVDDGAWLGERLRDRCNWFDQRTLFVAVKVALQSCNFPL